MALVDFILDGMIIVPRINHMDRGDLIIHDCQRLLTITNVHHCKIMNQICPNGK